MKNKNLSSPGKDSFSIEYKSIESNGEICGRHYASNQPLRIQWRDGFITQVDSGSFPIVEEVLIAPALFDLQINGYAGIDFQQDGLTLDQLLLATRGLRRDGCGRCLLTLITDDWRRMLGRLSHLRKLREQSRELQQSIAGWHLEGPFISAEPGYCGAHNPRFMLDPTSAHIREIKTTVEEDTVLLTLAPERPGAIDAIALAVELGMKVSLGHTDASAAILCQAVKAGATGFTHLGNGCPQQLDRHDNILWRVLQTPGLYPSVIPDGIHVSPSLFGIFHHQLKLDEIYYTTDAMSAAGAPPGNYSIGEVQVEVGEDEIVRQPGKMNFAGSALRPIDGVFRAAKMLNCSWQQSWKTFSSVPARFIGLSDGLEKGAPAHFCVIKEKESSLLNK